MPKVIAEIVIDVDPSESAQEYKDALGAFIQTQLITQPMPMGRQIVFHWCDKITIDIKED